MDIREYLRILRSTWLVVLLVAVVGVGLGFGSTHVFPKTYESTATLYVGSGAATSDFDAYQSSLFAQQRAISYAQLATTEEVARRASASVQSVRSADSLRHGTSASVEPGTVLLRIKVRDRRPERAQLYADALSSALISLTSKVDPAASGSKSGKLVEIDKADLPSTPTGPRLALRLVLGGVGGAIIGVLLGLAIGILDRRVRGRTAVEDVTRETVLGGLPRKTGPDRDATGDALDGDGPYAERLRSLRTNLAFATTPPGGPPRLIAVTSPGRAEGRTTLALDLAVAFAEAGKSVLLVDGDLRDPRLAELLELGAASSMAPRRGASTVLSGVDGIEESVTAVHSQDGLPRFAVLTAGPPAPRPGDLWATDRARDLFDSLRDSYDVVVVDTPPLGRYADGATIAALCDGAIVLARRRRTTTTAITDAVHALTGAHAVLIGTVLTFERGRASRRTGSGRSGATGARRRPFGRRRVSAQTTAETTAETTPGEESTTLSADSGADEDSEAPATSGASLAERE